MKIKRKAFAVAQIGIIGLPTVCYTAKQARQQSIETEREWAESDEIEGMTDSQIWRRLYKQGFRVVPVVITHDVE